MLYKRYFYTLILKSPYQYHPFHTLPARSLRSLAEDLRQIFPPSRFCPSKTQSVPARLNTDCV